jgi:hypothetical protein
MNHIRTVAWQQEPPLDLQTLPFFSVCKAELASKNTRVAPCNHPVLAVGPGAQPGHKDHLEHVTSLLADGFRKSQI